MTDSTKLNNGILQNYSNEGSTLDLVQYGLRLWEGEIVGIGDLYLGSESKFDQSVRLPPIHNNEASRLRLPSYIGFDSATWFSIADCESVDVSSNLTQSPFTLQTEGKAQ